MTVEKRNASYKSDGNVNGGFSGLVILCSAFVYGKNKLVSRNENFSHSSGVFSCFGG